MSRLVFWCLLIGVVSAATFRGKPPKKPAHLAHKEGCYVEQVKDVIPYGTQVTPIGDCMRIECEKEMIYYATCGVLYPTNDKTCHMTASDLRKPYPDCCPRYKCETDNQV